MCPPRHCRRLARFESQSALSSIYTMLFHTWPFLAFLLIVLPVFFALRKTRLWLPWLTSASYFFYGWWNPYYLFLVVYSTLLDYCLVALMDHCPREGQKINVSGRLTRLSAPPTTSPRPTAGARPRYWARCTRT